MKIKRLDDLQLFVEVAKSGSFSQVARHRGELPAVISAAIKRLEQQLEVRLFERTTRTLRLSQQGEHFLPYAESALNSLNQGQSLLSHTGLAFSGSLKLALPSDIARHYLLDWLEDYLAGQDIKLEVSISDRLTDLYREPIDLALRYGTPKDSEHILLPILPQHRRLVVASPDYLAAHGTPDSPAALLEHACLCFKRDGRLYDKWQVASSPGVPLGQDTQQVNCTRIADDGEVVHRWALKGMGIAFKAHMDVQKDLLSGRLVRLFPDYDTESVPLNLILVGRHQLNPAVRALADALKQELTRYF